MCLVCQLFLKTELTNESWLLNCLYLREMRIKWRYCWAKCCFVDCRGYSHFSSLLLFCLHSRMTGCSKFGAWDEAEVSTTHGNPDWTQGRQVSACVVACVVVCWQGEKATQTVRGTHLRRQHSTRMTIWSQAMTQKNSKPQSPTQEAKYEQKKYMSESNTELENHITRKRVKWLKPSRCVFCFPTVWPGYKKRSATSTGAWIDVCRKYMPCACKITVLLLL